MIEATARYLDSKGLPHATPDDAAAAEISRLLLGNFPSDTMSLTVGRALIAKRAEVEAIFAQLDQIEEQRLRDAQAMIAARRARPDRIRVAK